jgi:PhnB protein
LNIEHRSYCFIELKYFIIHHSRFGVRYYLQLQLLYLLTYILALLNKRCKMNKETFTPSLGGRGVAFAPQLTIRNGVMDIDFYKNAFGAVEHMRLNNDDGSVHVAEFTIDEAMFHLHEVTQYSVMFSPEKYNGGTITLGLMTADVHGVVAQAVAAGATIISPVTDYEYGYRQGEIKDPFGHHWMIECRIPASPDWKG